MKQLAIICDLDGTLALITNRDPYDARHCDHDIVNLPVAEICCRFASTHWILFVSGREDRYREPTLRFLKKAVPSIVASKAWSLLMRPTKDVRKDSILKAEIYSRDIEPYYDVAFVLDDRNQVVNMWRHQYHLTCLQVAEGDF